MWETINHYLYNGPVKGEIIESVLMIAGVLLFRGILLQTQFRSHPEMEIETKRRWVVVSRNVTLIVVLFGLAVIWAAQIQTLALSMFAVAAAIVLATKELIMCLSGSLLRATTKQYSVGDYIEVGGLRGRVVDINLLNTLMMQIGPNPLVGQLSGKTVSFPNSLLLSYSVQRDNILGVYVIHTFDIPVPIHLDSDAIVVPLQALLDKLCTPYVDAISHELAEIQTQKLFITPAAQPRVSRVPKDDKLYNIIVRFAAPVSKRLEIQQAVMDEFLRVQYRLLNEK
ncbi:mechanosensitive ion channel family protein [Neisseria weaveri]|uniref:Putative Sm-like integral membrane protein n=1 Tax=Neisseria weaveri TaxID=28091 RepID=A0A448VNM4_9NEIS|nr:mechanosensitive ion channel family protein [Neisseria weaveri]EGV35104.1 integral membrane protein [Neisseria weaveri LMG 5135]EGV36227.1 integral membrane protein [Neisseria weaveri ATCC 51223]SAY51950.1 putative Sm-like integral membrane protein [Neisseria weaveri]VEJ51367.1 putative Sm-like integral membrane protein [Neisseria weaveri]